MNLYGLCVIEYHYICICKVLTVTLASLLKLTHMVSLSNVTFLVYITLIILWLFSATVSILFFKHEILIGRSDPTTTGSSI